MKPIVKSSIHIQRTLEGAEEHNARENFSYSVVFFDEKNEYKNSSKHARKIYRRELKKREQAYFNKLGQSLQKSTLTKLSGIINLHQHHTIENLKPIISYLEERLDTKIYQIAIHRDEGKLVHKLSKKELYSGETFFFNPDNKQYYHDKDFFYQIDLEMYAIIKNYHAHIEMLGIDSNGKAIKKNRLHRYFLRELQTFLADTLKMQRGEQAQSYSKEEMKEILKLTGPKKSYASIYEWKKAFNRSAKSLGIFIEKKRRKDTKYFKNEGVIVQDLKEKIYELQQYLSCEKDDNDLLKEKCEMLEDENNSLEQNNFNLRDDIFSFRQGLQGIRRALDIYYNKEYKEKDITFEKFTVEEIDEVVTYVDKLIISTKNIQKNNKVQIKQLDRKNNALEEIMGSYTTLSIKSVAKFGKDKGALAKIVSDRYINIYKNFINYLSGDYYSGNKQSIINELQKVEYELFNIGYKESINEAIKVKVPNSNFNTLPKHKKGQESNDEEENIFNLKN